MSDLGLDVGQANELKLAFRRTGWLNNEEVKLLCEGDLLGQVRQVLLGYATIVPLDHVVDCDADPLIPQGWSLKGEGAEHRKGGMVKLERRGEDLYANGKKIELFLVEGQKGSNNIGGHKLRKKLVSKPVLNANVLDYLLKPENQHLIPESWKGKYVFFWGDVYRGSGGDPYVRYLCWHGGGWRWGCRWLDSDFGSSDPATVSASQ
ncbi:MAG: hypothetical protein AAB847_01780 [Patescibacteria group bacterium]